jgi:hypothetical protein
VQNSNGTVLLSAARLRGFAEDLQLEDNQFVSILNILYIGYMMHWAYKVGSFTFGNVVTRNVVFQTF